MYEPDEGMITDMLNTIFKDRSFVPECEEKAMKALFEKIRKTWDWYEVRDLEDEMALGAFKYVSPMGTIPFAMYLYDYETGYGTHEIKFCAVDILCRELTFEEAMRYLYGRY